MSSTDCHRTAAAFLLSLTVVLRVTSQQADVTTTRYHGDESYDVTVTSAAHEQYVNPRPGKRNLQHYNRNMIFVSRLIMKFGDSG